jgi:acyl carrier protein
MRELAMLEEVLHLGPGTLTSDKALREIPEWDSLAVLEFMAFADEKYGVVLSPDRFRECHTVADILGLLKT